MPFAAVGAVAAVASAGAGIVGSLSKGGAQSGAISQGAATATADLAPYNAAGTSAVGQQADLLGLNGQPAADAAMGKFQASPGYNYQVQQGLRAVDAGAASTGILRSGATIKAEETLGSNLADQDFGQYVSRLNSLTGTGESAASGQAGVATGAAGAQANIAGSESNQITNSLTSLAGNTGVQNALSGYFSPANSGSIYNGTTPSSASTGSTSGQAWAGTF